MADIAGNISKLNDVEISAGSPVTEALMNKIGANINALIDLFGHYQIFTSNGTFTVPENVTRVFLLGCGGGGGGEGISSLGGYNANGGAGGGGAIPQLISATVTPLSSVSIVIGSGGAGAYIPDALTYVSATAGTATTFGDYYFSGGLSPAGSAGFPGPIGGLGGAGASYLRSNGGRVFNSPTPAEAGERSYYARGGAPGAFVDSGFKWGTGGGGAGFGAGGNGSTAINTNGGDGVFGGGGGGAALGYPTSARGGNGGSGILIVIY